MSVAVSVPSPPSLSCNDGFVVMLAGQFVSRVGDALVSLAAVWLVLDLTGNDPLASSAALAFEFLPFLLFGLLGGVFADRWDRRLTMSGVDLLRGVLVLLIPLLHAAGELRVWHVYLVVFVLSSLGRLFVPARQALIPDLVGPSQLVRANAIVEGSGQAAWVLGPALGGVLVALVGAANVFYVDAATFVVSALSLLLIRPRVTSQRGQGQPQRMWQEAIGGIDHVRQSPVLSQALILSPFVTVAFAPVPALLPVLVRGDFGASARVLGLLMACFFVGSVAGSVAVAHIGERLHRGRTVVATILLVGITTGALALAPAPAAAGVILALLGATASVFNVAEYSLLQTETPPGLRGRVFAVAGVAAQALRPPAVLAAGLLAGLGSVRLALGVMACVALLAGLIGISRRALRSTK